MSESASVPRAHERVKREYLAFVKALPALLKKYRGRWVIFLHGKVQDVFDDEDNAFEAAVQRFGVDGGYVVVQVKHRETMPVTASVVYSAP